MPIVVDRYEQTEFNCPTCGGPVVTGKLKVVHGSPMCLKCRKLFGLEEENHED